MKSTLLLFLLSFTFSITSFGQNFTMNSDGIVLCSNASIGETGEINGVVYTKIDDKTDLQVHGGGVSADEACTSGITNMEEWFYRKDFNKDIGHWDVSSVTTMYAMFSYSTFNQDISDWNVSSLTNMNSMFKAATSFNQPIGSWDVSNVYDMAYLFDNARAFNQPLGSWSVSNVTKMQSMFSDAIMFNQPIGSWDVSKVQNMSLMFERNNFNQDIRNWNVSSVVTMYRMFYENQVFNQPIGSWDVSNVTNMEGMFKGEEVRIDEYTQDGLVGSQFNQDISGWNVSNVTTMEDMFRDAHMFNQDLSTWNVSSVTTFQGMFFKAFNFAQDISNWNVSNTPNFSYMFVYALDFNQDLSSWNVENATNMTGMFDMAWSYSQNLSSWCVPLIPTEPTNFYRDTKMTSSDLPGWGSPCRLGQVSLSSPTSGTTNTSLTPTLSWGGIENATNYEIQVSTDNFSSTIINTSTTSTSYTTTTLNYETTYSWRVRGTSTDLTGEWSQVWTFTTEDEPVYPVSKVTLSSPTNTQTGVGLSPTLSWNVDGNATSYTIQVSTDGFSTTITDESITSTSKNLSGLTYSTSYSWRVRASNELGDGEWSDVWSFTTEPEPVAPPQKATLLNPANDATNVPPTLVLSWDSLDDATSYIVEVYTNGTSILSKEVTETSYELTLNNNTTYTWKVRGKNSGGVGSWSDSWRFTIREQLVDPTSIVYPKNMAKGVQTTTTFVWKYVESATSYDFELYNKETNELVHSQNTTDTTLTVSGLDYEKEYRYRVRSVNSVSKSDWVFVDFTTVGMTTSNEDQGIPNDFHLGQNYPNPFNPTTSINYSLPQQSYVLLEVYDMMGQKISTLVDEMKSSGTHTTTFNATNLSSGTYIYRLTIGKYTQTKTMFLIK